MQQPEFPQVFAQLKAEIDDLPLTRLQRHRVESLMQATQQSHAFTVRSLQEKEKQAKPQAVKPQDQRQPPAL